MKIRLIIKDKVLPATLDDNASARDFYAMLPLRLTLEDYAATEKIAYLPRKLSSTGAPEGFAPSAGDITWYAPWGNLALFHKGFRYSSGLVSLGRIESGVDVLRSPGKQPVLIERAE
ncbi:cyclophilin-like fold protein [Uliginosibacterium sp. 31-16]|uniref:cyclophilin-like fold protein n=1 Tax=Uliginosibacterium sp. 31-16 TaxID=3068315 RepID=UPI002740154B|nr:cyclophilin-like fold protein [Uliginosibacterium sp. 31-16]MDP5238804.1 cyclophilin-like fold protein [Uliginosibacterium sp. 31-16]